MDVGPPSRRRAIHDAALQHARVVLALMLRDIKTRFGATYFGFLVGLLLPLAHIGIILAVYILIGRRAPIGTSVSIYLATAILPFILWSYTHQKIMQCFNQNKSLTSFPIVKFIDILFARSIVEILNSTLIIFVVYASFILLGEDIFVTNASSFFYALVLSYLMGISTGFIFGLLSILVPFVMIAGFLLVPAYWVTSGVFFIPDALPENARIFVALFPLSHIVDFGRAAFYPSYISSYANPIYVHAIIATNVLIGLAGERFLRATLTGK